MRRFRPLAIGLLALVAASSPLAAKTLTFDDENCHIDVPDDWIAQDHPGFKAYYISPGQTKSVVLKIVPISSWITLNNPQFIQGVEKTITSEGGTITQRQHLTLGGIDAYVLDDAVSTPKGMVYQRMYLTLANSKGYSVDITQLAAMPYEDDELKACVASFAFTSARFVAKGKTPEARTGYTIGTILGPMILRMIFNWTGL